MEDWTDLTVGAWVNTTNKTAQMRVVSKDRIGKPGNFMLLYRSGAWIMQAWDDQAGAWCAASWRSASINDGGWHSLVGIVDSRIRILEEGDALLRRRHQFLVSVLIAPGRSQLLDVFEESLASAGVDPTRVAGVISETYQGSGASFAPPA